MQSDCQRQPLAMHRSPRCLAKTRQATPCQAPAMPNGRCRMHGGTAPGAPIGNRNALRHGLYSGAMLADRRLVAAMIRDLRSLL